MSPTITYSTVSFTGRVFPGLCYHLESVLAAGGRPVLVSDHSTPVPGVTWLPIEYLEREVRWRSLYQHNSPNSHLFELTCFTRWLHVAHAMARLGLDEAWAFDADVLVFDPVAPCPVAGSTHIECRAWLCELLNHLEAALALREPGPWAHLSDLHVMQHHYGGVTPLGTCRNLYLPEGFDMRGEHKRVLARGGKPYFAKGDTRVPARTLHCWGKAKSHMGHIYRAIKGSGEHELEVLW